MGNITHASKQATDFLYDCNDDVGGVAANHVSRKESLTMLKKMRRGKKWWAAAACGYRKVGSNGLSAGIMIAT